MPGSYDVIILLFFYSVRLRQVDTAALQHHGTRYILGRLAVQVALVLAVFVFPPMHAHAKGGLTMDRSEPAEQARLIDTSMNANPHRIGPAEYLLANVNTEPPPPPPFPVNNSFPPPPPPPPHTIPPPNPQQHHPPQLT